MLKEDSGENSGLYLLLISVHGLLRGENLELGRDPDTGGQTTYVVELARALAANPRVERVDLVTRQIFSQKVDDIYSQAQESIGPKANIIRIPFGPRRYLRKERLWPYLDVLSDKTLQHIRQIGRVPDVVHGHYADAGYVGSQLARLLGVPFVFTGHSLGRVKRERLLARGLKGEALEKKYNFRARIEAEEVAIETASMIVASTAQEVEEQYKLYDHHVPERMRVIPPGIDLSRFQAPSPSDPEPPYAGELKRFLVNPEKPMILAIARPDERKNLSSLLKAYAETEGLSDMANLVFVVGNRNNLEHIPPRARRVYRTLMLMIDQYDLYGSVAYPKHHTASDIPEIYRLAAKTRGVFVNPALTEPFGLTLIEAAASGLPIVATNDGGPRDIIGACENGVLINPMDTKELGRAIYELVSNRDKWNSYSKSGIAGANKRYTWKGHVESYLDKLEELLVKGRAEYERVRVRKTRLTKIDRILVTTLDDILTGSREATNEFLERFSNAGSNVGFCIATGHSYKSALNIIDDLMLPMPDVLIAAGGSAVYYSGFVHDRSWEHHIEYRWDPLVIREALEELSELMFLDESKQSHHRIRCKLKPGSKLNKRQISQHLRQHGLRANVAFYIDYFIDILPIRCTKGLAIRNLIWKWGIPAERLLIAGHSGIDEEMLSGNTLGVVVTPPSAEIEHLRERPRIYFTERGNAWGLLEGIDHYNFFGQITVPGEEEYDYSTRAVSAAAS